VLKKIMAAFCCLLVLVPSVSVFAWNEKEDEDVITTNPNTPVDMEGKRDPDQNKNQPNTNSNKETYPVPPPKKSNNNNNSNEKSFYVDPKDAGLVLIRTERFPVSKTTTTTEERDVKERTLYYEWRVTSGPGRMTVHSSNSSVKQVNSNLWRAGDRITASFDTIGDYTVSATQIKQVTTTITPITVTRTRYLVYKYYGYPSKSGAQPYTESYVEFSYETKREEKRGTPNIKQEVMTGAVRSYKVRVKGPEPIEFPLKDETLQTTSTWIFSRRYACTNDIKDNLTNKPYELEVTYILEANTTITEVFRPDHLITRYKNLGTMVVTPVVWKVTKLANNKVMVWAKFSHPKAAVPGKSPMIFKVRVKTRDGTYIVTEQIDVPVNTFNLRFTNLPESERGEFYPIQGLTKFNNQEFVKEQPPIYHANIYVP